MEEQIISKPIPPSTRGGNGNSPPPAGGGVGAATAPPPRVRRSRDDLDAARSDVESTLAVGSAARPAARFRRRLLPWGITILGLAGVALFFSVHRGAQPARYTTSLARRGDLVVTVTATGALAALDTVDVGTEVSGVVDVVAADYNDHVSKGQTLAVVNTDQLQAQIHQSEAALQAASATAQQTAATIVELRPQLVRAESLFKNRMISQQDLEGAQASYARAVAADANAQADIAAASAALTAQRTVLEKATIRSPISGVVLQRQIEPGRTVAASFQTPVLFVLAADLKRMTLALDVDEADIGQVRDGQEADFTVDAYPDRVFKGTVRSVRNASKTVEGVVTYQAILDVSNRDLALRPGMTATATIRTAQVHDALLVPNAALRFTPALDSSALAATNATAARGGASAHQVWILRQGVPAAIAVKIGLSDGQFTQVIGGDVASGTPVITAVLEGAAAVADSTRSRAPGGTSGLPRAR